jgi:FixJ family two-component response regulator
MSLREALGMLVRSLGHKASTFGSAEDFLKPLEPIREVWI